jgi:hypothetical protein
LLLPWLPLLAALLLWWWLIIQLLRQVPPLLWTLVPWLLAALLLPRLWSPLLCPLLLLWPLGTMPACRPLHSPARLQQLLCA